MIFEDDFFDDSQEEEEEEEKTPLAPPIRIGQKIEPADEQPFDKEEMEISNFLQRSIKMESLSRYKQKTEVDHIRSLLYLLFEECEALLSRYRISIGFSLQKETASLPNIAIENNRIYHNVFDDVYDYENSENENSEFYEFLDFRRNLSSSFLPQLVSVSLQQLNHPLVKLHRQNKRLKHSILDLKKRNLELSVKTRQQANRLVSLSKSDSTVITTENDVLVHQQRLQHAVNRISELRELNEFALNEQKLLQKEVSAYDKKKKPQINSRLNELHDQMLLIEQNIADSEKDDENLMNERRVFLTKTKHAIESLKDDIRRLNLGVDDSDSKYKFITQHPGISKIPIKK